MPIPMVLKLYHQRKLCAERYAVFSDEILPAAAALMKLAGVGRAACALRVEELGGTPGKGFWMLVGDEGSEKLADHLPEDEI